MDNTLLIIGGLVAAVVAGVVLLTQPKNQASPAIATPLASTSSGSSTATINELETALASLQAQMQAQASPAMQTVVTSSGTSTPAQSIVMQNYVAPTATNSTAVTATDAAYTNQPLGSAGTPNAPLGSVVVKLANGMYQVTTPSGAIVDTAINPLS